MRGLTRPLTIFTSKKSFGDRFADDMQFGDMNELTLKKTLCFRSGVNTR
ncbi:DUF3289 family protein [Serratia sp. Tan611]|nr:DUF3289 family protein [Serratia sp. Tan611]